MPQTEVWDGATIPCGMCSHIFFSTSISPDAARALADPMLDRMLGSPKRELRVRHVMDKGEVLIVNLAKGRIGDDSSSLLGGLLVTTIGLAAYTRADTPITERRDFFVYIDEFQSFTCFGME